MKQPNSMSVLAVCSSHLWRKRDLRLRALVDEVRLNLKEIRAKTKRSYRKFLQHFRSREFVLRFDTI